MLTMRRRLSADRGFTLIELLITVAIMGVLTLPLGNLVISYFQNRVQVTARLSESHDAQIAAAYFAQDAASIGRRDGSNVLQQSLWTSDPSSAPYSCGSGGTPVLLLAWDQFDDSGAKTTIEVAYRTQNSGTQLVRYSCPGPSATQVSTTVMHDLVSATVGCPTDATACANNPGVPTQVNLTLTIKNSDDSETDASKYYTVKLTGQRRQT
jgi:prepilin-type N-terminal cleavage/methylation domain-containing protein